MGADEMLESVQPCKVAWCDSKMVSDDSHRTYLSVEGRTVSMREQRLSTVLAALPSRILTVWSGISTEPDASSSVHTSVFQ